MSSRIETVLFDLDGTLVEYRRSPGAVLARCFERVGVEPLFPVEAYYERFDEFAATTDSMAELRRDCFAALAAERGHDRSLGREVAAAFAAERDQSNVDLLPDARPLLREYADRYRLGVVTNGPPDAQRTKLDAAGIERFFDAVVVAGEDAEPKPATAPFETALCELESSPDEAIHIGDSVDTDVAGARNAGLAAGLVTDEPLSEPRATYVVTSLGELIDPPWEKRQ